MNTPIVIVGSSRAAHHYVTQMIEDSLGAPAYNVGRDGCFFSYNCCVVNSILDRYSPKLIIWENGANYLYEGSTPLENLYPYYESNTWVTKAIKEDLPWTENVKLMSSLYRYNSVIHRVIMRYFGRKSFVDETEKGYLPLKPKKLQEALELMPIENDSKTLSEVKIARFRSVLARAHNKGVKMVVVDSPMYRICNLDDKSAVKMREICEQYGMLFLNNSQLPYFLENPSLFNDATHMNDDGARLYTNIFLKQIKEYLR